MLRSTLILMFLACLLPAAPAHAAGMVLAPGDPAPEMWGRDANGEVQVVDYSAARFTLLNFFATWCQPCRDEMPMLQRTSADSGASDLQVVGVTYENVENEELAEFVAELGLGYRVIKPSVKIKGKWHGVQGSLPNSYLIGQDGRVLRRYVGATPDQIEAMERDLTAVIAGERLGTMVFPSVPAVATSADRPKKSSAKNE